jgi:CO dehydrogenase nickel-insertion accessory protein CooC1
MKEVTITVTGKVASGKTAIAYQIWKWLLQEGFDPVILVDPDVGSMGGHALELWDKNHKLKLQALRDKCRIRIETQQLPRKGV